MHWIVYILALPQPVIPIDVIRVCGNASGAGPELPVVGSRGAVGTVPTRGGSGPTDLFAVQQPTNSSRGHNARRIGALARGAGDFSDTVRTPSVGLASVGAR